jgi:hypothetical protein
VADGLSGRDVQTVSGTLGGMVRSTRRAHQL